MSEAAAKSSFLAAAVDLDAVLDDLERVEEEQQQQLAAAKIVLGNGENGNGERHEDNVDVGRTTAALDGVFEEKDDKGERIDEVDVAQVTKGLDVAQVTKGLDVAQVTDGLDVAQVTDGLCVARVTDGLESLGKLAPEEATFTAETVATAVDEAALQNGRETEVGRNQLTDVENGTGLSQVEIVDEPRPLVEESTKPSEGGLEIGNAEADKIEEAAIDPASLPSSPPPTNTTVPPPISAEDVEEIPDHFVSIYDVKGDDGGEEVEAAAESAPQNREEDSGGQTVVVGEMCDPSDDGAVGGARPKSKQNCSGARNGDGEVEEGETTANASSEGASMRRSSLGDVAPHWVPDSDAPACMRCELKFNLVKRRHHCRCCGKVLCNSCCSQKHVLRYLDDGKPSRVCDDCKAALDIQEAEAAAAASPAKNPPPGVLKKNSVDQGSSAEGAAATPATPSENKQVMFSDGVRPGGDLTELDGSSSSSPSRRSTSRKKGSKSRSRNIVIPHEEAGAGRSLLPESQDELPAAWGAPERNSVEVAKAFERGETISFIVNNNLLVRVKLLLCT